MKRARRATLQYTETIPQVNDTTFDQLRDELLELDPRVPKIGKKILPKDYIMKFHSPYLVVTNSNRMIDSKVAKKIVTKVLQGTLHKEYVEVWGGYHLITTCRTRSFYGRNIDTTIKEGIVIVRLNKLVIISRYEKPATPFTFIPMIELLADKLSELGY
ncbi:hypothetical protein AAMO2058_001158200 [Amorphochlora amoebiformis]